jgi:hypothetical protein
MLPDKCLKEFPRGIRRTDYVEYITKGIKPD